MRICLYISWYNELNSERKLELDSCLRENIENKFIDKIYLLLEGDNVAPLNHDKISFISIQNRPTYNDFFHIVNQHTIESDVNIISNSDIYFDASINLVKLKLNRNTCYALTRWENTIPPTFYCTDSSQDTWIFKGEINKIKGDFYLGKWACDNKIAYEIKKAGYKILNPSLSIITYHWHESGVRNYNPNLDNFTGPFLALLPYSFDSTIKILINYYNHRTYLDYLKCKFRLHKYSRPLIRIAIKMAKIFRLKFVLRALKKLYKI